MLPLLAKHVSGRAVGSPLAPRVRAGRLTRRHGPRRAVGLPLAPWVPVVACNVQWGYHWPAMILSTFSITPRRLHG